MNKLMHLKAEIMRDFPFLSPYLYKHPLKTVDDNESVAYTDYKNVYVNEEKANVGIVLHEYLHILFRHKQRFRKYRGSAVNVAADLVINEILIDSGISKGFFAGGITLDSIQQNKMLSQETIEELITLKENGAFITEEVLRIILNDPAAVSIKIQFNQSHDVASDDDNDNANDNNDSVEGTEEEGKEVDGSADGANKKEANKKEANKQKQDVANNDNGEIEKQIAAGMTQNQWILKELGMIKLRISFSDVLKKILQHVLSYSNKRQPNYMLQDYNVLQMGLRHFYRSKKKRWNVVIALDSSGSIGEDQFVRLASALKKQLNNVDYTYIVCDDVIQQVTNDISELKCPSNFGGTDFRPVFDYVNKMKNVSVLIYMTDTYGVFPSTTAKYPVYWVTQELKARVPFGKLLIWDPAS